MTNFWPRRTKALEALEPEFRTHYLAVDARQSSVAIAVWLIPVLLFAYGDYQIFAAGPKFMALLALRLAFCLFSLYTIAALTKVASVRDYDHIFIRWAAVTIVLVLYLNYSWAAYVPVNGNITILIIFSAYMVFPNRLGVRLVPPVVLSVGNLLIQISAAEPLGQSSLFSSIVALAMANLLGITFSTWLQNHRLTEFKASREEDRIKEELGRLASIDDLTGIYNRRKLYELATAEYKRFKSGSGPLAVVMIDIDYFKKLNDSYGHEAGDLLLTDFAAYVAANLREKHIWARLGGDEFALVLPELSGQQAKLVAERLRRGLHREFLVWQDEPLYFAISIGVTEARAKDQDFEAVLQRADKALYHAKRGGRNRTAIL